MTGQGGVPEARQPKRSAIPCSARYRDRQKDAVSPLLGVGDQFSSFQLEGESGLDQRGWHVDQLDRQRGQLIQRQAAMPLVHGLGQGVADPRPDTDQRRPLDPELVGDPVSGQEADAADVPRQPIRVLTDQLNGIVAVGLVDPHRPGGADTLRVQEQHDLADHLLLGPAGDDPCRPLGTDPGHLAQPLRLLFDEVEHCIAKSPDQFFGVDRADAADHP